MKPKGRLLPLLCVVAALLALPAGADAKPDYFVSPPSFSITAIPPKSNGFAIWVFASGHRQVEVVARRQQQFATYSARGRADRNGFSVDMGRFGEMQMRFHGSTHLLDNVRGCKGRRTMQGQGTFRGQFHFHGREDFVSVDATRIRGHFERSFRQVCMRQPGDTSVTVVAAGGRRPALSGAGDKIDVLEAESQGDGRTTAFTALRAGLPGLPLLVAGSVREKIGQTLVVGFTEPRRDRGSIVFSEEGVDPETVEARPGGPFRGEGLYVKPSAGVADWSGDLRVPIAGFGIVNLTGPGFAASTCHPTLETFSGCGTAQGSGSHSQPLALARLSSLR
jgi:hypothetical protein